MQFICVYVWERASSPVTITPPPPPCRDLVECEKEVLEADKALVLAQSENDFLMTTVMPVRVGVAGMARKMLGGTPVTVSDADEMGSVLSRISAKCAAIVDEIRKAIALADPDGHNAADWSTLQADEVRHAAERRVATTTWSLSKQPTHTPLTHTRSWRRRWRQPAARHPRH